MQRPGLSSVKLPRLYKYIIKASRVPSFYIFLSCHFNIFFYSRGEIMKQCLYKIHHVYKITNTRTQGYQDEYFTVAGHLGSPWAEVRSH